MADLWHRIEAEVPRLRRYARALTRNTLAADDLVQDCLVRALAKSHLWQEGSDLRAWLFTILHNQYVNQVRRAAQEGSSVPIDKTDLPLSRAGDQYARLELRDLDRALAQLPDEQRTVVLLTGLEGMRYEAVAEMIGVPVGTVRSRLSRGRAALRQLMQIEPVERFEDADDGNSEPLAGQPPVSRTRAAPWGRAEFGERHVHARSAQGLRRTRRAPSSRTVRVGSDRSKAVIL
jgi:RNA polymerase sigma-70 factor, ECF subfamily